MKLQLFLLAFVFVFTSTPSAYSKTLIKLSTLAPKDSSYHQALVKMGQEWKKISGGAVDLVVYPGGIQGGEAAMIKRMRIGQIQAALLTGVGLSEIEQAVAGLQSIPMMFRDFEEVDLVGQALQPRLEEMFAAKGMVVLFWTDAGWVQYFSRKPMKTPEDMRKLKVFTWANTGKANEIAKKIGMNPVPLETADILPGLKTGIIDVVAMPPFYALGTQIYTEADHMLALRWAPLAGGLVVDKKTWEKVPEAAREEMIKVAKTTGDLIKKTSRDESANAVKTMQEKWGLKVHEPTPQEFQLWRDTMKEVYPMIRGSIVPDEIWDSVVSVLEAHRAKQQ